MISLVNFTKDLKIINAKTKEERTHPHLFYMAAIELILNKDKQPIIKEKYSTIPLRNINAKFSARYQQIKCNSLLKR